MTSSRGASDREEHNGLPRSVDVVLSLAGLLVTLPLLGLAAAAIRLTSPGPALFRQKRVGRFGRPFLLLKLRTMRTGDGPSVTVAGDPRVTAVGRILRRTKVDELPQLWNVVRGEMSLVGPRPEVPEYVDLSDPNWCRILETLPGITDLVSLRLRFEEDLLSRVPGDRAQFYRNVMIPFKISKYLDYQSLRTPWTDLRVLSLTLVAGFSRKVVPTYRIEDVTGPL